MIRFKTPELQALTRIPRLDSLVKKSKEVELLYLFGSGAAGRLSQISDLDFALLLNRRFPEIKYFDYRLSLMEKFSRILGTEKVDVVLLNQASPLLAYEVISSGKLLYERNRSDRIDYECKVLAVYFDFKYYLQFHRETIKSRIH